MTTLFNRCFNHCWSMIRSLLLLSVIGVLLTWASFMVAMHNHAWSGEEVREQSPPPPALPLQKTVIVGFHRDESELLSDWIQYHAEIFGFENLHIIDHMSQLPSIQHLLAYSETQGVNIIHYTGSWMQKKDELNRVMKGIFESEPDVGTIVPLDIDEFIVGEHGDNSTWTTSPDIILEHFNNLPRDGFKYKFAHLKAAACSEAEVALDQSQHRRAMTALYFGDLRQGRGSKTFFAREGFISTDDGNHIGQVLADERCGEVLSGELQGIEFIQDVCFHKTPLGIVHYGTSALNYQAWVSKMELSAAALNITRGDDCDNGIAGSHYCKALQAIDSDPQGLQHCNRNCREPGMQVHYSSFMASALLGYRGEVFSYPNSPLWEDNCD